MTHERIETESGQEFISLEELMEYVKAKPDDYLTAWCAECGLRYTISYRAFDSLICPCGNAEHFKFQTAQVN